MTKPEIGPEHTTAGYAGLAEISGAIETPSFVVLTIESESTE